MRALGVSLLKVSAGLLLSFFAQSSFSVEGLDSIELFTLKSDPARPLVYATDAGGGEIIVIDTSSEAVVDVVNVGARPTFMDISPDGRFLAVALNGGSSVAFVNLETRTLDGTVPLPGFPGRLAYCGANQLFVGTGTSPELSDQIQVIDTAARAIVGTLDQSEVLNCNRARDELIAYAQGFSAPAVDVYDISVFPPVMTQRAAPFGGGCSSDRRSYHSSFSPDGAELYTTTDGCAASFDGIFPVFGSDELKRSGSFLLEWQPSAGVLSLDGSRLFAAHAATVTNATFPIVERHDRDLADLHVFSTETFSELARYPLSGPIIPSGMELASAGEKVFAIVETPGGLTIDVVSLGGTAFNVNGVVTSRDGTPVSANVELITESGTTVASVSTDANGLFEVAEVPEGRYSLIVDSADFQTTRRDNVVVSDGPLVVRPVRLVAAPADPATSLVYLGSFLRQILADPSRQRAYVSDAATNSVLVIDTAAAALVTDISVGSLPESMDISEDGDTLFVALSGGSEIAVVDLESLSLDRTIPLPGRPGVLAVCGGERLYVGTGPVDLAEEVQVVDLVTQTVVDTLPTRAVLGCNHAHGMLFTWEQGSTFPEIKVWDVSTSAETLVQTGNIFGGGCSFEPDRFQVGFSPDGSRSYFTVDTCSESADGAVPAFDTSSLTKVGEFLLEWEPNALALSPDGTRLFATHGRTVLNPTFPVDQRHDPSVPDIHVFDTSTFDEIDRLLVPGGLIEEFSFVEYGDRSLAVSPDGSVLFANVGTAPNQDLVLQELSMSPIVLTVAIDIKPGNRSNIINPGSKGSIWVGLLSGSGFEPLKTDISTVRFGPDGARVKRAKTDDINDDGVEDLLLQFSIALTGISCGDDEATLTGQTLEGQSISGTDSLKTVACR